MAEAKFAFPEPQSADEARTKFRELAEDYPGSSGTERAMLVGEMAFLLSQFPEKLEVHEEK